MSAQTLLSGGDKYYSYSGVVFGDVSVPATIQLILIPNTGLRDSLIQVQPYFGRPISNAANSSVGVEIKLNDVVIYKQTGFDASTHHEQPTRIENTIPLFIPRQSKLEVISLNTTENNTQERGANLMGYYL